MMNAVVVSDLHGHSQLYELLLRIADLWKISSVFIAGDLAPGADGPGDATAVGFEATSDRQRSFFANTLIPMFDAFLNSHRQTNIYAIMGNDDRRINEPLLQELDDTTRNFHLVNDRMVELRDAKQIRSFFPDEVPQLLVAGYPYVPLGSGALMDWVKHENRCELVPPGMDPCIDIESWGVRSVVTGSSTPIEEDLADFASYLRRQGRSDDVAYRPERTIHLFHAPPYGTPLDQTAPQGRYDFVSRSDHMGSSEIKRFIERQQPHLVLCGHCHEAVILGDYHTTIGSTRCVNPGSQTHIDTLSIVQFDPYNPQEMKQFFINTR